MEYSVSQRVWESVRVAVSGRVRGQGEIFLHFDWFIFILVHSLSFIQFVSHLTLSIQFKRERRHQVSLTGEILFHTWMLVNRRDGRSRRKERERERKTGSLFAIIWSIYSSTFFSFSSCLSLSRGRLIGECFMSEARFFLQTKDAPNDDSISSYYTDDGNRKCASQDTRTNIHNRLQMQPCNTRCNTRCNTHTHTDSRAQQHRRPLIHSYFLSLSFSLNQVRWLSLHLHVQRTMALVKSSGIESAAG